MEPIRIPAEVVDAHAEAVLAEVRKHASEPEYGMKLLAVVMAKAAKLAALDLGGTAQGLLDDLAERASVALAHLEPVTRRN